MGLFNSEMTPGKAVEMLGSDKEAKVEKGMEFFTASGNAQVPFMIESFQSVVSQAARSKKHQAGALNLYRLLCTADIPADMCSAFLKALTGAPKDLEFDLSCLPLYVIENGYAALESLLLTGDLEQKKKTIPFLEMIPLTPSVLSVLSSLLNRESGFAEDALDLISSADCADLSPVSDALYKMLDLYPLGDSVMKVIPELGSRLPPNVKILEKYLGDFNSMVQKRAVKVAVPLAEEHGDIYELLKNAILADESGRAYILEALEKKEHISPRQMDLVWLVLVHSSSQLTEERGMKFFARLGDPIRPLVLYYAQNGTSKEIICALKCIGYMREAGARICAELLSVYLNDDSLLFETAGYASFSYIASLMKQHCSHDKTASALAKKMRDYCVSHELETPTEVMALLGPEDLADVIEWSFKRIFESYGIGYTLTYVDDMMAGISNLVGFDKAILNSFIKAVGYTYSFDSNENQPTLSHKDTAAAINRLRSVNTPATCNLLHLVSRKRDLDIVQTDSNGTVISSFKLSFEEHRKLALDELERRGFPAYLPTNYLKIQRPQP